MSTALAKQVPLRGQVPQSGGLVDQSPVSSDSSQNEKSDSPIDAKTIIHTHRLTELSGELGAPADEKRFWWQRGKNFGTCTGFIAKTFPRRGTPYPEIMVILQHVDYEQSRMPSLLSLLSLTTRIRRSNISLLLTGRMSIASILLRDGRGERSTRSFARSTYVSWYVPFLVSHHHIYLIY